MTVKLQTSATFVIWLRQVAGDAGMDAHLKGVVHQRVVPLFETLSDLEQAGSTMRQLFSVQWYRTYLRCAGLLCSCT